ncbi:MAG: ABC transporter permease [Xanthomonadales bacterium]|jgi:predicted permease|nr:ABC transporter permease [Xanthomonadales bacterium]
MEAVLRDLRLSLRRLREDPGTSLIMVLTLAFGIGVTTAVFSLVDGVLLRDLPFRNADALIEIRQQAPSVGVDNVGLSVPEIEDVRTQNRTLEHAVEFHFMYFFIEGDAPALVKAGIVSADFFDFLGVRPQLGRNLRADDDAAGAEAVVLLSHGFWRSHFGSDPQVLGRRIDMNGRSHRVVGVLPVMPQFPTENDVYLPTSGCPTRSRADFIHDRGGRMMSLYARKRPGVSLEQVQSELTLIATRQQAAHPAAYPPDIRLELRALGLQAELGREIRPTLQLLVLASALLLLVTCTNIVNLTLARHSTRQREFALRMALGASRWVLGRRLLCEALLLAGAGGIGGWLIAQAGLSLLVEFAVGYTDLARGVGLDARALGFSAVITLSVGLLVGLAPLFGPAPTLGEMKEGGAQSTLGSGRRHTRRLLVSAQIALAFMLVAAAVLVVRGLIALQSVDPGFGNDRVTAVTVPLNWSRYPDDAAVRRFVGEIEHTLSTTPGVDALAYATGYPFGRGVGISLGQTQIRTENPRTATGTYLVQFRAVSPSYFEVLDIPLLRGRRFDVHDTAERPRVAVLSQSMAERYWPDADPVGQRFSPDNGQNWIRVVGVAGDVRGAGLDRPATEEYYLPFAQAPGQTLNLLVDTRIDPATVAARVRELIRQIDPGQPVTRVTTLQRAIADTLGAPRLLAQVLGLFSLLALIISLVGVTGLVAYTVSLRTRELGIRLALGARPTTIRGQVLREGLLLVAAGLLVGVAGSLALGGLAERLYAGAQAIDLWVHLGVASLFLLLSLLACWVPAARASRLPPLVCLRNH